MFGRQRHIAWCYRTVRGHAHRRHRRSAAVGQGGRRAGRREFPVADLKDCYGRVAELIMNGSLTRAGVGRDSLQSSRPEIDVPGMPARRSPQAELPRPELSQLFRSRGAPPSKPAMPTNSRHPSPQTRSASWALPAAVAVPCACSLANRGCASGRVLRRTRRSTTALTTWWLQLLETVARYDLMPTRSACIAIFEAHAPSILGTESPRCRTGR